MLVHAKMLATPTNMSALRMVRSPRTIGFVARVLVILLVASILGLIFVPWQQSSVGKGRVVAYAPAERQQTIEAMVYGRVSRIGAGIMEGVRVEKDQFLLEVVDNDPLFMSRVEDQRSATERKLETAREKVVLYQAQVAAFTEVQRSALEAATQFVQVGEQKLAAERQGLIAARAGESQAKLNYQRQRQLAEEGLASGLTLEIEERKFKEALAKLEQANSYVLAAQGELAAKQAELEQKRNDAQTKIDYARAAKQEALGEVANTEKDLLDLDVKLARQVQEIRAPRAGTILRIVNGGGGEQVKPGDPLVVLVPEQVDRAIELWIAGNDLPLMHVGREVRLQFEGWPAIQFSGWPSWAYGTYGGRVASIDPTDDGKGKFRVLVRPDPNDRPWPGEEWLRQGVRANGWVLLNEVTLGYEVWRQLNGFPPAFNDGETSDEKIKKPKLPK